MYSRIIFRNVTTALLLTMISFISHLVPTDPVRETATVYVGCVIRRPPSLLSLLQNHIPMVTLCCRMLVKSHGPISPLLNVAKLIGTQCFLGQDHEKAILGLLKSFLHPIL